MMVYKSIDGQIHIGATPYQVVQSMRDGSFDARELTVQQYMRRAAATAWLWSKKPIRVDNAAHFLEDLEATRIITRQDDEEKGE